MDSDLTGLYHGKVKIPSHLECLVRYIGGEWVVSTDYDKFDFFSGCNRGGSGSMKSEDHYICIYGLLLIYDERMGALNLDEQGFNISKKTFTMLDANLIGAEMARVEWPADHIFQMREVVGYLPCNVKWSNALRFDPGGEGRCLHFTASTKGTVFVIFSVIPKDKDTWYYVQISPYGVGIFKVTCLSIIIFCKFSVQSTSRLTGSSSKVNQIGLPLTELNMKLGRFFVRVMCDAIELFVLSPWRCSCP